MQYRRSQMEGGCYFFTVNLEDRTKKHLIEHIEILKNAFNYTMKKHPFKIDAIVILPEHLHTIWTLPKGDNNYSKRWILIKSYFSRHIPKTESLSRSRKLKRERGVWQRRYWEHQIKNEKDLEQHVNYIHYNPVKHGYVTTAIDWPHTSIHKYIRKAIVPKNWGYDEKSSLFFGE